MTTDLTTKTEVTFSFPTEAWEGKNGVLDAFSSVYNRGEGVSKSDFTIEKIQEFIEQNWEAYQRRIAKETIENQLNTELPIQSQLIRDHTTVTIT